MSQTPTKEARIKRVAPARSGAVAPGTYIEGQLGAYYLLQMLAGRDARGLPNARNRTSAISR